METVLKTPAAILNEKMGRKGIKPIYELIVDGTGTHFPTFKYKVTCDKLVTYGTARCKKIAKQNAAEAMLIELGIVNHEGACSVISTGFIHQIATPIELKSVEDQYPHQNALQDLLNLCKARSFSMPEFTTLCSGPSHAPYYYIRCNVEHYVEEGFAASKKVAKRNAAQKMVNRIKRMGICSLKIQEMILPTSEQSNNNLQEIIHKIKRLGISSSKVQETVQSNSEQSDNANSDGESISISISQLTNREKYLLSLFEIDKRFKKKSFEKTMPPEVEEQLDIVKKCIEKLLTLI